MKLAQAGNACIGASLGYRYLAGLCVSLVFPWLAAAAEFPVDRPVADDSPASTVAGNPFTIPAGWSVSIRGPDVFDAI